MPSKTGQISCSRLAKFSLLIIALRFFPISALSASSQMRSPSGTSNTLGPDALKDIVTKAASNDVSQTMDVTGILWLEHINLVVGSKTLAQEFYLQVLGFSKDRSKSFHCNLGQQQFHLAENGDPAQRVTGSIGLTVPSVSRVKQRVDAAFESGSFKETELEILSSTNEMLCLICPWGNRLHLYDVAMDKESLGPTSPHKMVIMHDAGGPYAPERMAIRGNPGIRYIEIACRLGTSPAIGRFYEEMMGCTVSTSINAVSVCVGPGVHVCYVENDNLTKSDTSAMEGVHICIYVNDFKGLYGRLKARDLVWTNPRFTHLDSCDTWEQAMASRTLRFKDIIDLETGEKVLELEHETRPLRHGQYLKVPFYEPK